MATVSVYIGCRGGTFDTIIAKCVQLYCSDVDGVIRSANNTEFGLASGVFTSDLDKALDVCKCSAK